MIGRGVLNGTLSVLVVDRATVHSTGWAPGRASNNELGKSDESSEYGDDREEGAFVESSHGWLKSMS